MWLQERLNREIAALTRDARAECDFELEDDSDPDDDADIAVARGTRCGGGGTRGGRAFGRVPRMSEGNLARASAFYEAAYDAAA